MGLSSNTLIQQTKFEFLKNILLEKSFKLSYCREEFDCSEFMNAVAYVHVFPMICFSEIPLGALHNHLYRYGECIIGMNKSWAVKNGFNPVHYYHKSSLVSKSLIQNYHKHYQKVLSYDAINEDHKDEVEILHCLEYQLAFAKNYSGRVDSKQYKDENYVFAEEKEWRFVPESEEFLSPISLVPKEFESETEYYQNEIGKKNVSFELSDVNYLVCENSEQKMELIQLVNELEEGPLTNIFTNNEIKHDLLGYKNQSIDNYNLKKEVELLRSEISKYGKL